MPSSDARRPPTPNAESAAPESPAAVLANLPHAPNRGTLRFFQKTGSPEVIGPALEAAGGRFFDHVVDPEVATRVVTHLAGFHGVLETKSGPAPPMVVHGDAHGTAYLAADEAMPPSVYYHELTHLLFDAYGYVTDRDADHDADATADDDLPTAVARERAYRRGDGSDPFVAATTPDAAHAANFELRRADPAVAPKAAAVHPRVAALADAVNASWWKLHRVHRTAPDELPAVLPRPCADAANDAAVHAHELAAAWGEVFLEEGAPSHPANWFFEHPELTAAFCRVVRPSDGVRRVANYLHGEFPERSPWTETPFPAVAASPARPDPVATWAASASTRVDPP